VLHALDRAGVEYKAVALDLMAQLSIRLALISETIFDGDHQLLFVGDSLAMDMLPPNTSIPIRLRQRLAERGDGRPEFDVGNITASGLSIFSHYFLSDRLIALHPDQIVLAVNLAAFSRRWRANERFQLAGWIPARCWPEAAVLPLHEVGVSADRLLYYRVIVAAGGVEPWRWLQREQVRVAGAYWDAAAWLQDRSGSPHGLEYRMVHGLASVGQRLESKHRPTRALARELFGPALDGLEADHPEIEMLDALLARFRGAGIRVVLYVAPINVEYLTRLGVYDAEGMARIEAVAQRRGAAFLDLHDLLPDVAFRDAMNHLTQDAEPDGARLVAERIAPLVVEAARSEGSS
jgi:hypothetical protein